jgi:cyclopropane fatty-acyl-phospholipid synthase-like methyltransferase
MRLRSTIKHTLARMVRNSSLLSGLKRHYTSRCATVRYQNSQQYWQERYAVGGDSGEGSYGPLARYKADFINNFCKEMKCESVIEFGCGDGNQLSLLKMDRYTGVDISEKCINECRRKLGTRGYEFHVLGDYRKLETHERFDMAMSLDVIYHLVEDDVYLQYLDELLNATRQHALIYASNFEHYDESLPHVKHRDFVKDIAQIYPQWELVTVFANPFLKQHDSKEYGSFAQFHHLRNQAA